MLCLSMFVLMQISACLMCLRAFLSQTCNIFCGVCVSYIEVHSNAWKTAEVLGSIYYLGSNKFVQTAA